MPTVQKWKDTPQSAFKRIANELRNFKNHSVQAAKLIAEAKEREIWKLKYDSFQEFAEKECGFSKSWAYELLRLSEKTRQLEDGIVKESDAGRVHLPDTEPGISLGNSRRLTEGQASAMKGLSADKQAEVFAAATNASDGKIPTPKTIAAARKALANGEPVVRDKTGYPVPENCLELWNRGAEIRSLIASLGEINGAIMAAQGKGEYDILWRECDFSSLLGHVGQLRVHLRKAEPYAICATCQGLNRDNCKTCKQRGMVSQDFYERCVPVEIKAMRQKAYATSA